MRYRFIEAQRKQHSVRLMCCVMKVSASGYYAACGRPASTRTERQTALTARIRTIHAASRDTYGAPRVQV